MVKLAKWNKARLIGLVLAFGFVVQMAQPSAADAASSNTPAFHSTGRIECRYNQYPGYTTIWIQAPYMSAADSSHAFQVNWRPFIYNRATPASPWVPTTATLQTGFTTPMVQMPIAPYTVFPATGPVFQDQTWYFPNLGEFAVLYSFTMYSVDANNKPTNLLYTDFLWADYYSTWDFATNNLNTSGYLCTR